MHRTKKKTVIILIPLIAIFLLASIIKKVIDLSIGPKDKNCHFLYPFSSNDPTKLTTLVLGIQKQIPFFQKGGFIDDMSCLNTTSVFGIVKPKTPDDIKDSILFAKENKLSISLAGVRHSMGGQSFAQNAVVLDMTDFNQMSVDDKNKVLTVQSGAVWHDVQKYLDPKGLSVKAMQSSDIFSVGGSISVNAHGMDHNVGSLSSTIRSMRIMLEDGEIHTISRTQNPELFKSVIGGYGLFGVIVDVELDLTDNVMYKRETTTINYKDFPATFDEIKRNPTEYGLFYAHLSTGPNSFLQEVILYRYKTSNDYGAPIPPIQESEHVGIKRFFLNLAKTGKWGSQARYWAEKYMLPYLEACDVSRNQALGSPEACYVSRNQDMHDSAKFLRNNMKNDTDILQEYFIPQDKFLTFIDGTRDILKSNNAVVLNVGIRAVNKEDITLNYAPTDSFAIVLYLNQKMIEEENTKMEKLTREMINLTISLDGKPYLPYQQYYTSEQLQQAYPNLAQFFELKKQNDPELLFTNSFYRKYSLLR